MTLNRRLKVNCSRNMSVIVPRAEAMLSGINITTSPAQDAQARVCNGRILSLSLGTQGQFLFRHPQEEDCLAKFTGTLFSHKLPLRCCVPLSRACSPWCCSGGMHVIFLHRPVCLVGVAGLRRTMWWRQFNWCRPTRITPSSRNRGSVPFYLLRRQVRPILVWFPTRFDTNGCNSTRQGVFAGLGGGFYNRGDIVVDGESYFSLNAASVRLKAEGRNACIDCGSFCGSLLWCCGRWRTRPRRSQCGLDTATAALRLTLSGILDSRKPRQALACFSISLQAVGGGLS